MTHKGHVSGRYGELTYIAAVYLVGLPIISSGIRVPLVLAAVLYSFYPFWFALWLVALFGMLQVLGRRYATTKLGQWWWFSVPYSVALPALSIMLHLGSWSIWHVLGLFAVVACVSVPSSLLWAVVAVARISELRRDEKVMLSLVPIMILLWIVVLRT